MTIAISPPDRHEAPTPEFWSNRILESLGGAMTIFTMYIGDRLGYYRALARTTRGLTSAELAASCDTVERYTREWLEQQATTGFVAVDDIEADGTERRYSLPPGAASVLVDRNSLDYFAPLGRLFVGATRPIHAVVDAHRHGGGVPYKAYGEDMVVGQAEINRPMFLQQLGHEWLPALPDVHAKLEAGGRVADIGCGAGYSSIGIATAYPEVRIDGYDADGASIKHAVRNAAVAEVDDRVNFYAQDAVEAEGTYDLVIALECLHDMCNPVEVLRNLRRLAGEDGTVLIVDERTSHRFGGAGSDIEWMLYGWSVLHCLPVGMTDAPCAGTGTVMRPDTLREYAQAAGFADVEVLPIDNFLFRFYKLVSE